jgi:hypothetical protein
LDEAGDVDYFDPSNTIGFRVEPLIGTLRAMPRITISYRRDDSLDITGRIFDRLAEHFGREAVFRDIDNIPPGADFRRHIDRVLDESDIILAIVGPRWIGPDNERRRLANPADPVRVEIEIALRKDKLLIPVLVSRAVMPQPEALPDSLRDFAYRNAIQVDSGQDFDVHVGRLIRAMERELQRPALEVSPRPGPLPTPRPARTANRRLSSGWFVLGVMIVVPALVVLLAIVARSEVAATWPAAARLYAWAGWAPRLELGKVVPTRTANSLVIEGDVTNAGNLAGDVPQLRVVLNDSAEKEVQFKIIDPPKARLGPSETARFKTTFEHPNDAATGVVVVFAR